MSWQDKIQAKFSITTGDGKVYTPLWYNPTKSVEYNISQFNFPGISGTLVKRGTPQGARYPLEFYFEGENCIDDAESFKKSADDNRPWVIQHPFYGSLTVHPVSLTFDNTQLNVSKITGTVIETITEDNPKTSVDPVDRIANDKESLDSTAVNSFDVTPSLSDVRNMSTSCSSIYTEGTKAVKDPIDADNYFNAFNTANAAINNATSEPLAAMRSFQAMINAPSLFKNNVQARLSTLVNQFNVLHNSIVNITDKSTKKIYEVQAGSLISSMTVAASTPLEGDYENKTQVLDVIDILSNNYNLFIEDLDLLQTDNGGEPDSYVPDQDSIYSLDDLLNFTLSNLYTIALGAKQERIIYLDVDSNVINLAHKIYGLEPDDSTIELLMKNNKIGLSEILGLRKGRQIVYYV